MECAGTNTWTVRDKTPTSIQHILEAAAVGKRQGAPASCLLFIVIMDKMVELVKQSYNILECKTESKTKFLVIKHSEND